MQKSRGNNWKFHMAILMNFQIPPSYLVISPMEFALKTNTSAIPTGISDFFSVCLCTYTVSSERTQVHTLLMASLTHRATRTRPQGRGHADSCCPGRLRRQCPSSHLGSQVPNFHYRVLRAHGILKPTLNAVPMFSSDKKVPKTCD